MRRTRIQGLVVFLGLAVLLLPATAIAQQGKAKSVKAKGAPKLQTVWISQVDIMSGGLDRDKTKAAITKSLGKLEKCFQKRRSSVSQFREYITFKALVSEKGKVISATVVESSVSDDKLMSCARNNAMDVRYPARKKGSGYASLFYDIELDSRGNPQANQLSNLYGGGGTIGLGNLNTIGKSGGSGGGSGSKTPVIRTGTAAVRGSLTKEQIRAPIRRHINQIRYCYEQQLVSNPNLAGRVQIRFVISASGAVTSSSVAGTTLNNPNAEQCVARAVQRIAFPQPQGGGVVIVTYPFMFQTGP